MPTLPSAGLTINAAAGGFGSGGSYLVVMSCVSQNADSVPRVFASTTGLLAEYGYSPAIDYCSMHFNEVGTPIVFVGLPITTAGAVVRQDNSAVTGSTQITVSAAASGIMEKVSGTVTCVTGTTVGTDQIVFNLSCDGGQSTQKIRLGSNLTYTIPYLGITLTFTAGTFNPGDTFAFQTSAPMWGSTAIATAKTALAAQMLASRSWLIDGELPTSTFAGYVVTAVSGYETANQRYTYARAQVVDFLPLPENSRVAQHMSASGSVTFASTGHTITRTAGSFVTDGFANGQIVAVTGSTLNNGVVGALTSVSATVLTFASGVVNETVASGLAITASPGITFAAAGFTATRTSGSWITEGFAVGQTVAFTGTSLNNFTGAITALSATVMTFASGPANEGPLQLSAVTCNVVQTFGGDVAAQTSAFATIDAQKRIDLAYGHGVKQSPITGWLMRRPAAWAASLREYSHDVQIPCWRKSDGPLTGWGITDANGNTTEFDERVDGGALAGRFTCLRSYGNGPLGAFVALSLTRDSEGSLLSRTHNLAVANIACTVVQAATENEIGTTLLLNADGTGTSASLSLIEKRVNRQLQIALLQPGQEGKRASSAVWSASRTDILNVPGATMNGVLALNLNGTLEHINTSVVVQTAGT